MILFFDNLSIIDIASGSFFLAAAFFVSSSNFFITVLVDLCWYLFLSFLVSLDLILFIADL